MSRRFALAATTLAVCCAVATAADSPGLQPGKKAPAFKLKDQSRKEQSLAELTKKQRVALVFYRSANW